MSLEVRVEAEDDGRRLDVVLVRLVRGMSRATARRMIAEGEVRVNGRRTRKGSRVRGGDAIHLEREPAPKDFDPSPNPDAPLVVVAEDAAFLVLDKPAGLPCHPLRAAERETLVNALVARHPEVLGVGYRRREAGLVHRLDNHTSGVVLVARRADAFATLRAALQDGRMQKRYRAVIRGPYRGPEVIDIRLASDPADPRRVVPVEGPKRHRRRHRTHVEAVERHGPLSLLTVDAPVAGRHQIRAHLAAVGHPLVGDWLYGGPPGAAHHLLHASSIAFAHPDDPSTPVVVHAPLPAPWTRLLRMASGSRPG